MNTPIKPPGGTPFTQTPEPVADAIGTEKSAEPFQDVLDEVTPADALSHENDDFLNPVHAIADQLRTGEIDTPTAIDKLVKNALEDLSISGLPPEKKLAVEKLLRAALEEDPTLVALAKDLRRQEPIEK